MYALSTNLKLSPLCFVFFSLSHLRHAQWSCPVGTCSERTQNDWAPSAFACLRRSAQEFEVRLVPYRDKNYLDRLKKYQTFEDERDSTKPGLISLVPTNISHNGSFSEGIVQTYRDGAWRPVCANEGFGSVREGHDQVCKQLGYRYASRLIEESNSAACEEYEAGVRIGKCNEGEKIGQCTKQCNQNLVVGGCDATQCSRCAFPDVNPGWRCGGAVALRCSNYTCLESGVNTYFPADSWQQSTWITNATFLFRFDRERGDEEQADWDGFFGPKPKPHALCECIQACLVAGAAACGVNCFGCFAGSSITNATDYTCWDGQNHYQRAVPLLPVDVAKNWNAPVSEPNFTPLPHSCLRSSLAVRFFGSATYIVNQEDGPIRYILQGTLYCLFRSQAPIILMNTSVTECEWRVEFFFATENSTAQSHVLRLLENYTKDRSQVYDMHSSCIEEVKATSTSLDMQLALTIFKSYVTKETPLVEYVFDERWPDTPCKTSTTTFASTSGENSLEFVSSTTTLASTSGENSLAFENSTSGCYSCHVADISTILLAMCTFV